MSENNVNVMEENNNIFKCSPAELMSIDYNELRSALRPLKAKIQKASAKNRTALEEQYCYIVRELEHRQEKSTRGSK